MQKKIRGGGGFQENNISSWVFPKPSSIFPVPLALKKITIGSDLILGPSRGWPSASNPAGTGRSEGSATTVLPNSSKSVGNECISSSGFPSSSNPLGIVFSREVGGTSVDFLDASGDSLPDLC